MASVRDLVQDVDQAIAFYTRLGFTLRQQFGPAMAIVVHDDLTLWLAGPRASASKPMPDGRTPGPEAGTASFSRSPIFPPSWRRCARKG
jgi:catechol 2,3-dioxygenase-like lactoylglutathione lyase family enzyme